MDFDFSQEQVMLRNLAREFFSRESTPRIVRQQMEDATGYTDSTWRQLADMGVLGLVSDPDMGMIEQALVLDEMGRNAYVGPYFATAVLAASALKAAGDTALLPKIAGGEVKATVAVLEDAISWQPSAVQMRAVASGTSYALNGTKRFVPWAHVADKILVVARTDDGTTVFVVERDAAGLTITPNLEMDRTNKTATLTFENVNADTVLGQVNKGWDVIGPMLQRAAIAASAEMLGAMRRCMEMSVEYAKVRHQFGQPIGMFQAIKHACAEMLLEVENSHGAVYYAAWAMDAGSPDAALAASVAKAYVGDSSRKVCGSAIQVHGGIGFTWEYDLHLYFKRAKHLEALYGDADFHREQALRLMLDQPAQQRQPVLV